MGDDMHVPSWLDDVHAFRRLRARVLAALVARLGVRQLDIAEDAVQDAIVSAFEKWRYHTPVDPAAWLYQVAWRKALDRLARERTAVDAPDRLSGTIAIVSDVEMRDENCDDDLTMLFLCAHPLLSVEVQVTLMLRMVCSLSVAQIANALLVSQATVSQRIVRAKRTLSSADQSSWDVTAAQERVEAVRHAVYLMFTEGYAASDGDSLVRRELCVEAIRLAELLAANEAGRDSATAALCALLHFQWSRTNARERDGVAVPIAEQDRTCWDRQAIARGFRWLERARTGTRVTRYHLQAGIASVHAMAIDGASTDWNVINRYYEQLRELGDSPVLRLNHAVALSQIGGAGKALMLLDTLDNSALSNSHLLHAVRASLHEKCGNRERATEYARKAVAAARTMPEHRLLAARLAALLPEQSGLERPNNVDM